MKASSKCCLIERARFREAVVELDAHAGGRINLGSALEVGGFFVPGTSSLLIRIQSLEPIL